MQLESKGVFRTKIEYVKYEWLKNIALTQLGIKNINYIRDRFEGQAYFNNFLIRSYGELALEKFLGSRTIDLVRKENDKNYQPRFQVNAKKIGIIAFAIGENPKIAKAEFDIAIFIKVNIPDRTCEILGFLNRDKLVQLIDSKSLSPLDEKNYLGMFKTFDELSPLNRLSLRA